jgi:hypothetical protein
MVKFFTDKQTGKSFEVDDDQYDEHLADPNLEEIKCPKLKKSKVKKTKDSPKETPKETPKEISEEEHYNSFKKTTDEFKENKNRKYDYVFTIFYEIPEGMSETKYREEIEFRTKRLAPTFCKYIVFGYETCPESGRKHLQGYLHFGVDKSSMIKTMKCLKILDVGFKPWLQERFGTINRAVNYCKKGEQSKDKWFKYHENKKHDWGLNAVIVEVGTKPICKSDLTENRNLEQTKWLEIQQKILHNKKLIEENPKGPYTSTAVLDNQAYNLLYDIECGMSLKELSLQHPAMYFKYNNAFEKFVALHKPKYTFNIIKEYGAFLIWQDDFLKNYLNKLIRRCIFWIIGKGNDGKSELSFHLEDIEDYNVISNGKSENMAYRYTPYKHTIINLCRSNEGHINYDMLEAFKDGRLDSSKYVPERKVGPNNCHVIVFANFFPTLDALSHDRWVILEITSPDKPLKKWNIKDIIIPLDPLDQ